MHKEWLSGAPLQVPGNEAMSCLGNITLPWHYEVDLQVVIIGMIL